MNINDINELEKISTSASKYRKLCEKLNAKLIIVNGLGFNISGDEKYLLGWKVANNKIRFDL